MNIELERLVNGLINDTACYNCETEIKIEADDLNHDSSGLYTTFYSCPGCEAEYSITVEDEQMLLQLEATRIDDDSPDNNLSIHRSARKEALHRDTHPIRDLVEGFNELATTLTILWQNRERIHEACDTFRDEGLDEQDADFERQTTTDVHNYMASAYTFDQILHTTKPNLPTGGSVEDAEEVYEDENRVIIGLRVYAQHNLNLPFNYTQFVDDNTGNVETTLTVGLGDVNVIESDKGRYPPDGYKKGADHHYEKVEGDTINIERRVDIHYEAAENLVQTIADYAEEVRGDELKEYRELTSFESEKG